jgi:hypothetical protein
MMIEVVIACPMSVGITLDMLEGPYRRHNVANPMARILVLRDAAVPNAFTEYR